MAITMAQAAFAMYGGGTANFARKRRRGKGKGNAVIGRTAAGRAARIGGLAGVAAAGLAASRYGKIGGGSIGVNTRRLGADIGHVRRGLAGGIRGTGNSIANVGGRAAIGLNRAAERIAPKQRRNAGKRVMRNIAID
ncbi:hypothetical protein [Allocoleopsis sp.]|uniref:hypothetical protein n=1 Tax=Allocoleopsis sp. TaxID=3088169 RepID=UPI002FD4A46E